VHAAAGGVGGLLIQVAKLLGAKIYGTVSSDEKAAIAREAGADEVILYTREDFEEAVMRLTQKRGVDVVYDSVGKTTFDKSLNCVARRGMLVMFGQSSGAVPPFDLLRLSKNAGYLTRPSLHHYTATRAELLTRATDVFAWIRSGKLRLRITREFPLRDARKAHELLLSRQVAGKLLLIP
jgi:NADPH:quinone reductase